MELERIYFQDFQVGTLRYVLTYLGRLRRSVPVVPAIGVDGVCALTVTKLDKYVLHYLGRYLAVCIRTVAAYHTYLPRYRYLGR